MKNYWGIGGTYKDTRFVEIAEGMDEERHGPFVTRVEAKYEWQRLSWRNVDNCHHRYTINRRLSAFSLEAQRPARFYASGK